MTSPGVYTALYDNSAYIGKVIKYLEDMEEMHDIPLILQQKTEFKMGDSPYFISTSKLNEEMQQWRIDSIFKWRKVESEANAALRYVSETLMPRY
jgi:hypothetical protein